MEQSDTRTHAHGRTGHVPPRVTITTAHTTITRSRITAVICNLTRLAPPSHVIPQYYDKSVNNIRDKGGRTSVAGLRVLSNVNQHVPGVG